MLPANNLSLKSFIVLLMLLTPAVSWPAEGEPPVIGKIVITGNERTRESVIRAIIRTREGEIFTRETPLRIKRYLDNQRKFSRVEVTYKIEDRLATILIYVKDKWSLIAAPYYSYKAGESSYGFLFLESNFLGYQNVLFLSSIYEYEHLNGKFLYSHPRVLGSLFSYVALLERDYHPVENYRDGEKISEFMRDEYGGLMNFKYQFYGEHYLMLLLKNYRFEDGDTPLGQGSGFRHTAKCYVELDWLHFKDFMAYGTYVGIYYENDLGGSVDFKRAGGKIEQFFNPVAQHNLYLGAHFFYTFDVTPTFEARLGQDQTEYFGFLRGYEKGQIEALQALTASMEYRIPLVEVFSTTLIFTAFTDLALSTTRKEFLSLGEFDYAVGGAFRFYLKEVLIPAVQVYAAYGFKYENLSIGVMIGARL